MERRALTVGVTVGVAVGVTVGAGLLAAACGRSGDEQLLVFAASSLTDAFDRLEDGFEATHPGVDVVVSYGGSPNLVGQIEQGAPADVLATADRDTMNRVLDLLAGPPAVFAGNRLTIAVEPGNPRGIASVADLAQPGLVVVLADREVPAGAYAAQVLEHAGVTVDAASYESSVRAVAAKVALGEADAGIVYRTDVAGDPSRLDEVVIPDTANVLAEYPIATVRAGEVADEFVRYVLGPAGRAVLAETGFALP